MRRIAMAAAAATLAAAVAHPASGDELRRISPGQLVPDFELPTLDGGKLGRADLEGKAVILVFLSAQQRRSETAAAEAHAVKQALHRTDVTLVFATADTDQLGAFRRLRATAGLWEPLLLDGERKLYGELGLIVLPTTIVIDPGWRLAHVISSHRGDYGHMLRAYAEHALGMLDDEKLAERLAAAPFQPDATEQRIARHRAAAEVLRERGLLVQAAAELRKAIALEPSHVDARLDLAGLLIAADRVADAAIIVDAVLATSPGHRRGRLIHGVVLYRSGRLDAAEAELSEMLLLNADPVQTHYYLGLTYEQKGDKDRAMEHYKQSLARLIEDHPL